MRPTHTPPEFESEDKFFSLHTEDSEKTILANISSKAERPLPDNLTVTNIKSPYPDAKFPISVFRFVRNAHFASDESIAMLRNLTDAISAAYPGAICHERHTVVESKNAREGKHKCGR